MCKIPRLFKLIDERNITAKKLSEVINVSTGNISDWKSGRSTPSSEKIVLIAKYFNVSTDYLLGLTEDIQNQSEKFSNTELRFINKFKKLSSLDQGRILERMDVMLEEHKSTETSNTARVAAFGGKTQKVPDLDISLNDRIDAIERQALIDEIKASQDPKGI